MIEEKGNLPVKGGVYPMQEQVNVPCCRYDPSDEES